MGIGKVLVFLTLFFSLEAWPQDFADLLRHLTIWADGNQEFPTAEFEEFAVGFPYSKERETKGAIKRIAEVFDRVSVEKLQKLTDETFADMFRLHKNSRINRLRFDTSTLKFRIQNEPGGSSPVLKRKLIQPYLEDALFRLHMAERSPLIDDYNALPPSLQRLNSAWDSFRNYISSKKFIAIHGTAVIFSLYFLGPESAISSTAINATLIPLFLGTFDRLKKLEGRLGIERLHLAIRFVEREKVQIDSQLSYRAGLASKGHRSNIACPSFRPCTAEESQKAIAFREDFSSDAQIVEEGVDFFRFEEGQKPVVGVSIKTRGAVGDGPVSPNDVARHFRNASPQGVWIRFPELDPYTAVFHPVETAQPLDLTVSSAELLNSPYASFDPGRRLRSFLIVRNDAKDSNLPFSEVIDAARGVGLVNPVTPSCSKSIVTTLLRRLFISGQ